jgi:hypothetical protein
MILLFYIIIFFKSGFVVTFNFFSIDLSWSYYLDHMFCKPFFYKSFLKKKLFRFVFNFYRFCILFCILLYIDKFCLGRKIIILK